MNLEMIPCTRCSNDMPKLRLDKFGYNFCVTCSDVMPKVGRIRVVGEGDHTATEMDILDQSTAKRLQELENTSRGVRNIPLEILNFDEDEVLDDEKALLAATDKILEGEIEVEDEEDLEEDLEDISEEDLEDEE